MLSTSRNQYLLQRVERTLEQVMAAQEAAIRKGQFRPAKVDLHFGDGARWPALSVPTPAGNHVDISGSIDRIDIVKTPEGDRVSVLDYRLRVDPLRWIACITDCPCNCSPICWFCNPAGRNWSAGP